MPYLNVYLHFVWSTKNRFPFLQSERTRNTLWTHIKENARNKGIFIDTIGGYSDHCHCLLSLGTNQTIEKLMQLIKGESSFWMNKQKVINEKFEWQDEYYVLSVSKSMINRVRSYILKQEEHHRTRSFKEELELFLLNDESLKIVKTRM